MSILQPIRQRFLVSSYLLECRMTLTCCQLTNSICLFAASLMGAQSFPNLTTTGTTSTVTMSTSIVTSSNSVATATTGLSVGQLLSNTLTTSLTSTSSESDTGQEAEFSLYGDHTHTHTYTHLEKNNIVRVNNNMCQSWLF